jgi:predicted AAA+ superfamily ATPase
LYPQGNAVYCNLGFNFTGLMMINRNIRLEINESLKNFPVVAILGPRQAGKSTIAKDVLTKFKKSIYLDLEHPGDIEKLSNPLLFFNENREKLICLDEIQRAPEIFPILRSIIDENNRNGQFLLLGSASPDLLKQSSESLAGRIIYKELTPFLYDEIKEKSSLQKYWTRGGFPRSFLSQNEHISFEWLNSFILTFLERDIPQLGYKIPTNNIRRLWTMCAHLNGDILNSSKLGESLGVSNVTVRKYLDLLVDTYMLRLLKPYVLNIKKRIVKSPKIYIRDIGITNALLQITDFNQLISHPKFGASWESIVIENIASSFKDFDVSFYRTQDGAEVDLILHNQNMVFTIECKSSMAPKVSRGFWSAIKDIGPNKSYIAAPVKDHYKIAENSEVGNFNFIIQDIRNYIIEGKNRSTSDNKDYIKLLNEL